jgi:molybdopterin-binding protein
MKVSARNQFKGRVIEITEGVVTGSVVVDIGGGKRITSTISMDALRDLGIKSGSEVTSIIKASSVMIAVD